MKTIHKLIAGLFAGIVGLTSVTSCQDDFDHPSIDAPVATLQANTTIFELKKTFWDDATNYIWGTENVADATPKAVPVREDGTHYIIKGRVISSDEAGNVFKSLIIQDETGALALSINSYNLYLRYRRGQEVVLDVTGMYIGKYNGLLQLGMPEWYENGKAWEASFMSPEFFQNHVELNGWPEVEKCDTIVVNSFSELPSDPDGLMKWQSQLVRFNNVTFVNGGKETFSTYHSSGVNQTINDSEGNPMIVRTSGYSNFWNRTLPEGNFDLVCIASYYGTTGWQLIMMDYTGCMNIGNATVAPGSENMPWTVDQAVAEIAAGKTPSGWVTGYIVGAVAPEVTEVKSNEDIEWTSTPVLANTLVIGQSADTKDINSALVIELPYGSKLRQQANLVDNPSVYGKQIWVRATLDKYMGTYGLTGNNGTVGSYRIDGLTEDTGIADGNGEKATPYSAKQVISGAGSGTTGWAIGYIVGSSNGKSASEFTPGADNASGTNIFIANTPDETDYTKCVPVQLPVGDVRTALNLASNPGLVGMKVSLYGSFEKYFGQPGIKTVTEYVLDGTVTPPTPPVTDGDGSEANPYTCANVIAFNPQSTTEPVKAGVWVSGYIVGWADMSSTYVINAETARFSAPATMATNLLMADNAGEKDVTKCIGVQLPAGDVRSALNLQDNAGNLGKALLIKGDISKYSGVPGIRSASAYKIDGQGTPDVPDVPSDPVSSINENFDASTSIPAGWTQVQVAGDKDWYVREFSGNNYITMSGYKGTAPFDQYLITPPVDMAKVSNKTLAFDTQVNGYGATTTVIEALVLDGPDPKTAKATRLNASFATAPASGYSEWVSSGALDLSGFSGVVYIAFRYSATTDANYATWCVDNVKLNADGGSTTPDDPVVPPTPSGDFKGDFNSFNGGAAKASPYGTYTNATGWTATNSIILSGTDDGKDANPYFQFIGAKGTLAPTLNGKAGSLGTLTSPTLTGGITQLTFNYGFAFTESACAFTVTVSDTAGNVIKTDTVDLDSIEKMKAYSYTLDLDYTGDFVITITNNGKTGATGNKDRVSIWNLTWTSK